MGRRFIGNVHSYLNPHFRIPRWNESFSERVPGILLSVADSANTGRPSGSNIGPFPSTSIMVTRDAGRSVDMDKKETC